MDSGIELKLQEILEYQLIPIFPTFLIFPKTQALDQEGSPGPVGHL